MAILDTVTPLSRRWDKIAKESAEAVLRAAHHQAYLQRISDYREEARCLSKLYSLEQRPSKWQEYGEFALHLAVSYPPDLAYTILYGLRDAMPGVRFDPAPLALKALEEMHHFRPSNASLRLELTPGIIEAIRNPSVRAERAAHVLVREISCVPLRHASGIWNAMNPTAKPFVRAAMNAFNPRAARILSEEPKTWWLTPAGFLRGLFQMIFGEDQ